MEEAGLRRLWKMGAAATRLRVGSRSVSRQTIFFRTIAAKSKVGDKHRKFLTGVVSGAIALQCLTASQTVKCVEEGEEKATELDGDDPVAKPAPTTAPEPPSDPDVVEQSLDVLKPIASKLGFGGALGWSAGYALKKIGKMAAFATGCLFVLFQSAAYSGLIDIHWDRVQKRIGAVADVNDDGKVDLKDAALIWRRYLKPMLTYHLPSTGGFACGFLFGVRSG